jgi:hypothetical protein
MPFTLEVKRRVESRKEQGDANEAKARWLDADSS